jgi:hypothetical protein
MASSVVVETVGRRKPILISTFLIAWFNAAFAIYMYYWVGSDPETRTEGLQMTSTWLPKVTVYGFTLAFCIGMSNVLMVGIGSLWHTIEAQLESKCKAFKIFSGLLHRFSWESCCP